MSLTPRSRLMNDSHRSPSGATSEHNRANTKVRGLSGPIGAIPTKPTTMTVTIRPATTPLARPSSVLLGLAADIGVLPKYVTPEVRPDVVAHRHDHRRDQDADPRDSR